MESAVSDQPQSKVSQFFRSLGPGILMASAAVGGSHLVASTKAGAMLKGPLFFYSSLNLL